MCRVWCLVNMSPASLREPGTFKLKRQGLWGEAGDQISWEPMEKWDKCVSLSSQRKVWGTCVHREATLLSQLLLGTAEMATNHT